MDVILGFTEMGLETSLEVRIGRLFDHLRGRLHDLLFGVIDVPQLVHEQVIEISDVFIKQAHGHRRSL